MQNDSYALDAYLRECGAVFARTVAEEDLRHACGGSFSVGFLECDGRIARWKQDLDVLEAVMTARCESSCCAFRDEGFHYYRFRLTGAFLVFMSRDSHFKAIAETVASGLHIFLDYLRELEDPWDRVVRLSVEEMLPPYVVYEVYE